ncbi:hypothetical protein ACSVIJ_10420 [Pseudomonas sp. NCHU5208]|uniref:hypothetical protein n=1 Tax=unclassified Pseudomonas TaxID=196821 RepID=UPI003F95C907
MTDRPTSLDKPHHLDPQTLCELASLRLESVQALIKVLIEEQPPKDAARIPRHTLATASRLLGDAAALYRRAVRGLPPDHSP